MSIPSPTLIKTSHSQSPITGKSSTNELNKSNTESPYFDAAHQSTTESQLNNSSNTQQKPVGPEIKSSSTSLQTSTTSNNANEYKQVLENTYQQIKDLFFDTNPVDGSKINIGWTEQIEQGYLKIFEKIKNGNFLSAMQLFKQHSSMPKNGGIDNFCTRTGGAGFRTILVLLIKNTLELSKQYDEKEVYENNVKHALSYFVFDLLQNTGAILLLVTILKDVPNIWTHQIQLPVRESADLFEVELGDITTLMKLSSSYTGDHSTQYLITRINAFIILKLTLDMLSRTGVYSYSANNAMLDTQPLLNFAENYGTQWNDSENFSLLGLDFIDMLLNQFENTLHKIHLLDCYVSLIKLGLFKHIQNKLNQKFNNEVQSYISSLNNNYSTTDKTWYELLLIITYDKKDSIQSNNESIVTYFTNPDLSYIQHHSEEIKCLNHDMLMTLCRYNLSKDTIHELLRHASIPQLIVLTLDKNFIKLMTTKLDFTTTALNEFVKDGLLENIRTHETKNHYINMDMIKLLCFEYNWDIQDITFILTCTHTISQFIYLIQDKEFIQFMKTEFNLTPKEFKSFIKCVLLYINHRCKVKKQKIMINHYSELAIFNFIKFDSTTFQFGEKIPTRFRNILQNTKHVSTDEEIIADLDKTNFSDSAKRKGLRETLITNINGLIGKLNAAKSTTPAEVSAPIIDDAIHILSNFSKIFDLMKIQENPLKTILSKKSGKRDIIDTCIPTIAKKYSELVEKIKQKSDITDTEKFVCYCISKAFSDVFAPGSPFNFRFLLKHDSELFEPTLSWVTGKKLLGYKIPAEDGLQHTICLAFWYSTMNTEEGQAPNLLQDTIFKSMIPDNERKLNTHLAHVRASTEHLLEDIFTPLAVLLGLPTNQIPVDISNILHVLFQAPDLSFEDFQNAISGQQSLILETTTITTGPSSSTGVGSA